MNLLFIFLWTNVNTVMFSSKDMRFHKASLKICSSDALQYIELKWGSVTVVNLLNRKIFVTASLLKGPIWDIHRIIYMIKRCHQHQGILLAISMQLSHCGDHPYSVIKCGINKAFKMSANSENCLPCLVISLTTTKIRPKKKKKKEEKIR